MTGLKRKIGVEIECTGLTRNAAARAIGRVFDSVPEHLAAVTISIIFVIARTENGQLFMIPAFGVWTKTAVMRQESMPWKSSHRCWNIANIPLLQEIVRAVRSADGVTGAQYNCGIHIHVDGAPYTAQSLRNLVNIFCQQGKLLV